jgi:hypothetical protein
MTEGQPERAGEPVAAEPPPASELEIPMVGPLAGDEAGDDAPGGDPVCWARLVCAECGAVTTEGHRAGCSRQRS